MMVLLYAGILAAQPLMTASNDAGVWFVRDNEPGSLGPMHELCQQTGTDKYQVVLPLAKRPVALAVHDQTLWFIGEGESPVLYRARLAEDQSTGTFYPVLRGRAEAVQTLDIQGKILDLLFLQDEPILVVENGGLQCFNANSIAVTPLLPASGGRISVQGDSLIAVTPDTVLQTEGIRVWQVTEDGWQGGDFTEVEGKLHNFIFHENWPLLILTQGGFASVVGLLDGKSVEFATFPVLAGRWAVIPKHDTGLAAIWVERNGTVTTIDIGWLSRTVSKPIVLSRQHDKARGMEITLMILTTVAFFILISTILRNGPKKSKKTDSSTQSDGR